MERELEDNKSKSNLKFLALILIPIISFFFSITLGSLSSITKKDVIMLIPPFLMINGDLEKTAEMYEFLGDILGQEERAKALADYSRSTIEDTMEIGKTIPENEKVNVYYASTQSPFTYFKSSSKDSSNFLRFFTLYSPHK